MPMGQQVAFDKRRRSCYSILQTGMNGSDVKIGLQARRDETAMPIYEYRCQECGREFELFVRAADKRSEPVCPECGSTRVSKAVSLFGVAGTGKRDSAAPTCGSGPV